MARRSAFSIKFDIDPLSSLAGQLEKLTPEKFGEAIVEAVNDTVDRAYDLGRQRMLGGINLTDEYLKRKMLVERATEQRPVAKITAFGGNDFLTNLSHYGAMQEKQDVVGNGSNRRLKGNAAFGIPVGQKAAGRSVEVVKGQRKNIKSAFGIPGRNDGSGTPIVFRRIEGTRTVEALLGPSVYQLFRIAAKGIEGSVGDDLEQAVIDAAERRLQEALG